MPWIMEQGVHKSRPMASENMSQHSSSASQEAMRKKHGRFNHTSLWLYDNRPCETRLHTACIALFWSNAPKCAVGLTNSDIMI